MVKRRRGLRGRGRGRYRRTHLRLKLRRQARHMSLLRRQKRSALLRRRRGYITLEAAARIARVSRQAIHAWRSKGLLEVKKVEGEVLVLRARLLALLCLRRKVSRLRARAGM